MIIEENTDKIKEDFNNLYDLYNRLRIEINRLEGKNGYIQQIFKEWDESTYGKIFKNANDRNLVLDQEKSELEKQNNDDKNALRFFRPYYDDLSTQISKGNIPDFFRSKEIKLDIDMPNRKSDVENFEEAQNQYINMSKEQRTREQTKILKKLAIIYAREANIFNRFKMSQKIEFSDAMKNKSNSMSQFLKYATLYNSKVSREEQIAFGINDSEKGPVLEASLPGYTRLSVHFGTVRNCKEILGKVNRFLDDKHVKRYFPTFKDGGINLKMVYDSTGYNLPKFEIFNTGIINNMEYADSEIYEQQIRGKNENDKVNSKRVEIFVNFMYPDLNDREVFYLAEKSEFGKKHLEDLKEILKERDERRKIAKKNKVDIRDIYMQQEIEMLLDKKSQIKKINEFYLTYLETSEIKLNVTFDNFISLLEQNNIDKEIREDFIKNKEKENEKNIEDMEFEEILKLACAGKKFPKDVFSSKFMKEEEPDFLYEQSENDNIPPKLREEYFKTILNIADIKSKVILLFRTIETKFANELVIEDENAKEEYQKKSEIEKEKLKELVWEETINNETLDGYGDIFVEIISDASELIEITNNNPDNKNEQIRLVKNLWDNYEFVISTSSKSEEILKEDKEEFRKILDSYWVDDEIADNYENLTTETYNQMRELAYKQNVIKRKEIEKEEENILSENSKSIED